MFTYLDRKNFKLHIYSLPFFVSTFPSYEFITNKYHRYFYPIFLIINYAFEMLELFNYVITK